MRARAALLLALLVAALLAGCSRGPDARADLVPYPRLGDVATYDVAGVYVELTRWENGHAFHSPTAQARFTLAPSGKVLDAARAIHPSFSVKTELAEGGVGFVRHSERFVSPERQSIVQAYYPHSQDQGTVSFDERGHPWLFGASPLFGIDLARDPEVPFALPDNLGTGRALVLTWRVEGREDVDGVSATKLVLDGAPGIRATLWMEPRSAWPLRALVEVTDRSAEPHVRLDGPVPAVMDARRASVQPGAEFLPAVRERGDTFSTSPGLTLAAFDGEKPPDGPDRYVPYLLEEAVGDAKLVDRGLVAWLASAQDPRLYRATYLEAPAPAEGVRNHTWLLSYMDKGGRFYTTQMYRLDAALLGVGVPLVGHSGPSEAPKDPNHGWFPASALPSDLVPLSEGVRLVRDAFGAQRVEIFLRSFADPPGYSYFIDGGFEGAGRYTVIVNAQTGLMENATGPVTPRMAE